MELIRFELESNSSKKLDSFAAKIIATCKRTNAGVRGPVCFKGKRVIIINTYSMITLIDLRALGRPTKVSVNVLTMLE